ncbi:MAG: dienelactone hydrolase family protein [Anaerolineae bacterium]|nr:dienelactone hydrolase family protein [Anaerolineae bacterium]
MANGYLAVPHEGKGPGVLVLHPWWGLNDTIKEVCDRLAAEGFVAFAPDLYHGKVATTIAEAEVLAGELDGRQETVIADMATAVDLLWEHTQANSQDIGVVGFSLGAYYALRLSGAEPVRVRAVVLFYGTGDGDFAQASAAYQGHFAETDPYEPKENVEWLESALTSAGRAVAFYHYPGVGHWFFERDRTDAYNEPAARLAWERTLAFLKQAFL